VFALQFLAICGAVKHTNTQSDCIKVDELLGKCRMGGGAAGGNDSYVTMLYCSKDCGSTFSQEGAMLMWRKEGGNL
jgi:hypothetical protein